MNRKFYLLVSAFLCSSCSLSTLFTPKATILKEPNKFRSVVRGDNFNALAQNVRDFAANFAFESDKLFNDQSMNYAVSPLSMFSALAVASACADGNTKQELVDALKTTPSLLEDEFANLYSASNVLKTAANKNQVVKKEELTNSLWLDKNVEFNSALLDLLAEKFYSFTVQVDYLHNYKKANKQMSKFVEEKTNGLLSPKFNFDPSTILTILNTLYLKTLWYDTSDDMSTSSETYDFVNRDKSIKPKKLFVTNYQQGRILRSEKYSSFFAQTVSGDRIKFVVPNDGYELEDVINSDTILEVNNATYNGVDELNKTKYYGKTYFPGFEAECDIDAKGTISALGVKDFFTDGVCDFSPLTGGQGVYCDKIMHATKLKVEKRGIEGAAYTAVIMKGESALIEPEYTEIYEDFVVDKAFYYVVSDHNNLPLFSGVVNKI